MKSARAPGARWQGDLLSRLVRGAGKKRSKSAATGSAKVNGATGPQIATAAQTSHGTRVTNWDGSISCSPRVVTRPEGVNDLVNIIRDPRRYPSPIRPVGSNFSSTRCTVADKGTIIDMSRMNRIIEVGADGVRVQAGARYAEVAAVLRRQGLQLPVQTDLGNMTLGSAACTTTRGLARPGHPAQLSAYVSAMKLVSPTGNLVEVNEQRPDLLRVMRSSYGLLGIVYEVTIQVRPLSSICVFFDTLSLEEFADSFDTLMARQASLKFYLHPFRNAVTVEASHHSDEAMASRKPLWRARNWALGRLAPALGAISNRVIPLKGMRYRLLEAFNGGLQRLHTRLLSGSYTLPLDQIRTYTQRTRHKYTYSTWAFPECAYPRVLEGYFDFCREYYRSCGYRCNMQSKGMRLPRDAGSLLSVSFDGPVLTLDACSTGDAGWDDFLVDFNEFCSSNGGIPAFNQTKAVTHDQALRAFGKRLRSLGSLRKRVDPGDRLLNAFFMQILE